jgi:hypothetical protein
LPVHKEIALIAMARGWNQDQLAKRYNAADPADPKRFTGATVHEQLARTRSGVSAKSRRRYVRALGILPDHLDLADNARPLSPDQLRGWRDALRRECQTSPDRAAGATIIAAFEQLGSSVQERLLRAFALGVRRANLGLPRAIEAHEAHAQRLGLSTPITHMVALAQQIGHPIWAPFEAHVREAELLARIAAELCPFLCPESVQLVLALVERLARERGLDTARMRARLTICQRRDRTAPARCGGD